MASAIIQKTDYEMMLFGSKTVIFSKIRSSPYRDKRNIDKPTMELYAETDSGYELIADDVHGWRGVYDRKIESSER